MKWIDVTRSALRELAEKIGRLDRAMMERDIQARKLDVELVTRYQDAALQFKARGINAREFCKSLGDGQSYQMMRRRITVADNWDTYVERRRAAGDCGRYGLMYAVELLTDAAPEEEIEAATESRSRETVPAEPAKPPPPPKPKLRGWLTPPVVTEYMKRRWPDGIHDICPHPRPEGYDALAVKRWPDPSYCNPPYEKDNELYHRSKLVWVREGIYQHKTFGIEVAFLLPILDYVGELIMAGAEVIPFGRAKFLDVDSKQPAPNPVSSALFILPGRSIGDRTR